MSDETSAASPSPLPSVRNSWAVFESSPDPGGLPRYPLKSMILVAFALLALQGVAEILRRLERLKALDGEPDDPAVDASPGAGAGV